MRLERALPLVAPDLTLREYAETLELYLPIYVTLERAIDLHEGMLSELGFDWPARRKVSLIRRDLDALGSPLPSGRNVPLDAPRCTRTFSHVMGCLYVLEGSTLGGRLIGRHVETLFHIGPESGAAFFGSYGTAVTAFWTEFCDVLERALPDDAARESASEGAIATFDLFSERVGRRTP
jgi:heme oxygenase